MKGQPEVIDYLNFLLCGELAARDRYFVHSRRYDDLGLVALHERLNHEMEEETQHADTLLRRILLLEGEPDMRAAAFEPGTTVEVMPQKNLDTKCAVRQHLVMGKRAALAVVERSLLRCPRLRRAIDLEANLP